VIRVAVGEHDGGRTDPFQCAQPIRAAIDHNPGAAAPDKKRAMAPVAARFNLDLAARTEKRELDLRCPWACSLRQKLKLS
jgi:hypothetical protein